MSASGPASEISRFVETRVIRTVILQSVPALRKQDVLFNVYNESTRKKTS